jgi:hypothetical protein
MPAGGARPGSGRKKNGTNRVTQEAIAKAEAGGLMPLDYMLGIMRNPDADEARRIDCAKAAAMYVHPKLAAIDLTADVNATVVGEVVFKGLNG